MPPSLFTLQQPLSVFHVLFGIYTYLLPILLYALWASLSLLDLASAAPARARIGWGVGVLLVPWLAGAYYLLARATTLSRRVRYAVVGAGLLAFLVPLVCGLPFALGPLGPKAL